MTNDNLADMAMAVTYRAIFHLHIDDKYTKSKGGICSLNEEGFKLFETIKDTMEEELEILA